MNLINFLKDERGATVTHVLPAVVGAGVAVMMVHGLHRPIEATMQGVAVAGIGMVDELKFERNFARDTRAFRLPTKNDSALETRKILNIRNEKGEEKQYLHWQWKNDQRVFTMPVEALKKMFYSHLARDVLAAVTTMYLIKKHKKHEENKVITSMRELCRMLNLCPNQKNYERLEEVLTWLRLYTIYQQNIPLKEEKGKLLWGSRVFGFCDYAEWIKKDEHGNPLPPSKQRIEIKLSDTYISMIEFQFGKNSKKNMLCTIPVPALEATRKLPREHRVPAKNIVYYLSGRGGRVVLTPEKIIDIAGFHPRWKSEVYRMVHNLLSSIEKAGITKVTKKENGNYELVLKYSVNTNVINADFDIEPPSKPEIESEEDLPF